MELINDERKIFDEKIEIEVDSVNVKNETECL